MSDKTHGLFLNVLKLSLNYKLKDCDFGQLYCSSKPKGDKNKSITSLKHLIFNPFKTTYKKLLYYGNVIYLETPC